MSFCHLLIFLSKIWFYLITSLILFGAGILILSWLLFCREPGEDFLLKTCDHFCKHYFHMRIAAAISQRTARGLPWEDLRLLSETLYSRKSQMKFLTLVRTHTDLESFACSWPTQISLRRPTWIWEVVLIAKLHRPVQTSLVLDSRGFPCSCTGLTVTLGLSRTARIFALPTRVDFPNPFSDFPGP